MVYSWSRINPYVDTCENIIIDAHTQSHKLAYIDANIRIRVHRYHRHIYKNSRTGTHCMHTSIPRIHSYTNTHIGLMA